MVGANNLFAIDGYWAIEESFAAVALENLRTLDLNAVLRESITRRREIEAAAEIEARSGRGSVSGDEKPYAVIDGVAVLSIKGPLTEEETCASWLYGGTATSVVRAELQQALADADVKSILLYVNSPGGQVSGTSDLANAVAAVRGKKAIDAYIANQGCSAAYWIASQADRVFANETALVGSIGTYMTVTDQSRLAANIGATVHVIKAGAHKGAGTPGTQVTAEQLAEFQRTVDGLNARFTAAVAKGRNLSSEQMAEIADGRVHVGKAAQKLGLIDGIGSFEQSLSQVRKATASRGKENLRMSDERKTFLSWLMGNDPQADDKTAPPTEGRTPPTSGSGIAFTGQTAMQTTIDSLKSDNAKLQSDIAARDKEIADLKSRAEMGDKFLASERERVSKLAVAAMGAEAGAAAAAIVNASDIAMLGHLSSTYTGIMEAKGTAGKDGATPPRKTAPSPADVPQGSADAKPAEPVAAADGYIGNTYAYVLGGKK